MACTNTTGVPAAELHSAVVSEMRAAFTPESFRAHLGKQAANVQAKEQRAAERAGLIADLPKLAATEQRLVKRIGTVEDDALVAALKDEWKAAKGAREAAERRVAEIEGIERDLAADQDEVEALLATWGTWSKTLAKVGSAAPGSVPAELQAQARQVLKKLLVTSIRVLPNEAGDWSFAAYTRTEGLLMGGLNHGKVITYTWPTDDGFFKAGRDTDVPAHPADDVVGLHRPQPIAGGSDGGGSAVRDTDMAPHTPNARSAPGNPWRSSITRALTKRVPAPAAPAPCRAGRRSPGRCRWRCGRPRPPAPRRTAARRTAACWASRTRCGGSRWRT